MVSGCPLVKAKIQPQIAEAKIISIVLCVEKKKKRRKVESVCFELCNTHTLQCTHIHTYTRINTHTYTHINTHTYTHINTHTHTHINTHTYTHTSIHTHTHINTHAYTHNHIQTWPHTTYIHMYTYTVWCSEIGSLWSLDAPELHASVTSENQFHCTRPYIHTYWHIHTYTHLRTHKYTHKYMHRSKYMQIGQHIP